MDHRAFTPTEWAMLVVLQDGLPHRREELHECLDPLSSMGRVKAHVSSIRKKLLMRGETIICELNDRRICYRWVRLITTAE